MGKKESGILGLCETAPNIFRRFRASYARGDLVKKNKTPAQKHLPDVDTVTELDNVLEKQDQLEEPLWGDEDDHPRS